MSGKSKGYNKSQNEDKKLNCKFHSFSGVHSERERKSWHDGTSNFNNGEEEKRREKREKKKKSINPPKAHPFIEPSSPLSIYLKFHGKLQMISEFEMTFFHFYSLKSIFVSDSFSTIILYTLFSVSKLLELSLFDH